MRRGIVRISMNKIRRKKMNNNQIENSIRYGGILLVKKEASLCVVSERKRGIASLRMLTTRRDDLKSKT